MSQLIHFSENELHRKDPLLSIMAYSDVSKRVLKFETNFSEVFKVLSQMTGQIILFKNGFRKLEGNFFRLLKLSLLLVFEGKLLLIIEFQLHTNSYTALQLLW